ncbi:restin homolog [Narcine bancroftii]|uniref:restin homolog n=1 Tax=Narcine bancroftii TaxID=1343680 RepID=UPI00383172BC
MEHQAKFRQHVLPHYLEVTSSVLTLNTIISRGDGQDLSPEEESRLKKAVQTAQREMEEAVAEGKVILEAVDRNIQYARQEKQGIEEEVRSRKEELLQLGSEVVGNETLQGQLKEALRGHQQQVLQAEATIIRENSRKAAKKTLRDLGFGLLLLPIVGIPLILGASREMCLCQAVIDSEIKKKAEQEKNCDQTSANLDECLKNLKAQKQQKLAVEGSLREKEGALLPLQEDMSQLLTTRRKVFNDLGHLTTIKDYLDIEAGHCALHPLPGLDQVGTGLRQLVSVVQSQSLSFELLGESRVLSLLGRLDSRGQD